MRTWGTRRRLWRRRGGGDGGRRSELELELTQSHMAQKPVLRGEVGWSESNMEGGHVECKVTVGPSAAWGPRAAADAGTEEASGVTTTGEAVAAEDWRMGDASAEAATTATGGAAATGAKAAAEAKPVTDGAPSGQRPKPVNWGSMTKAQR